MSVKVQLVTTDGRVLDVDGAYGDMDDAAGDTRGDLYNNIYDQFGPVSISELRFRTNRPIVLSNLNDD